MGAFEVTDIILTGIKHIEDWLAENGYTPVKVETWQPGSADVHADGDTANILIQVRTIIHPQLLPALTANDRFTIKELAERTNRVPYIACITLNESKDIVGEINWERII